MKSKEDFPQIADAIKEELFSKTNRKMQMKVKTLLEKFGYEKRTEDNTAIITQLLGDREIIVNPSIMKLGESWQLTWGDRVFLSHRTEVAPSPVKPEKYEVPDNWNADGWFDKIVTAEYRTEKEVENKFIIPLLNKLGFKEEDRYDGMTVKACFGSRESILETDFSLFNKENELLSNQVLLVVEAKIEKKLHKEVEMEKAQKQVKSYAIWLSCRYGLITDDKRIQVLDLFPSISGMKCIFECTRERLKDNFSKLYSIISKPALTEFYLNLMK
jgi:hypothetical protein